MKLFQWIKDRVNWAQFCYSLHLFVSLILVVICVKLGLAPHKAAIIVLGLGMLKEFIDKSGDMKDLVYDGIGIVIGFILCAGYY